MKTQQEKRRPGRPRKQVRDINPVRQIGRWSEADWGEVRAAATRAGLSVAAWVRRLIGRELGRS